VLVRLLLLLLLQRFELCCCCCCCGKCAGSGTALPGGCMAENASAVQQ